MSQLVVPDQLVVSLYQRSYIYNKYIEQRRSFGLRLCEAAFTGTQDKREQSCRPKGLATPWPVDTWRYRQTVWAGVQLGTAQLKHREGGPQEDRVDPSQTQSPCSLFLARRKQEKGRCRETSNRGKRNRDHFGRANPASTFDSDSNVQEHLLPVCATHIPQLCGNSVCSCH